MMSRERKYYQSDTRPLFNRGPLVVAELKEEEVQMFLEEYPYAGEISKDLYEAVIAMTIPKHQKANHPTNDDTKRA